MSLRIDHNGHRSRSRSPGHYREHSAPGPIAMESVDMPSLPTGYSYDYEEYGVSNNPPRSPEDVVHRRDLYRAPSPADESSYYRHSSSSGYDPYAGHREKDDSSPMDHFKRGAEALLPPKYAAKIREASREREIKKEIKKEKLENDLAYGSIAPLTIPLTANPMNSHPPSPASAMPTVPPWGEYPRPDQMPPYASPRPDLYEANPRSSAPSIVTAEPGGRSRRSHSPVPPTNPRVSSLAINTGNHSASSSLSVNTSGSPRLPSSSTLQVNTGRHSAHVSLSSAPPSPMLEAYHGTYQSISPMPSPLLMPTNGHSSTDLLEPLSPGLSDSEAGEKQRRRARFHDAVDDTTRLSKALRGDRHPPDTTPLIEILPGLTHDQVMELRAEYKRQVKTGPEAKGVNVAKHIRARLKDEDPSLMKACYATALGRWESEAYWANFWYQGDKTRRELLIESLMGRTNAEVRRIKDAFSDKKYRDSLAQCMRTELKEDKFKRAVLLALEERRMEERDAYGRPLPVDFDLVRDDIETLYRAIRAEKGGETAMLQIVVLRSDAHLRELLRMYEKSFGSNFARDALKKSGNLVGEVLAHILNGVINKPVRDALLLHHALKESRGGRDKDSLRRELLTSRLVRYHWDRHHMAAVKKAYRERYGVDLADAVREGTSGQWGLFCQQLVVHRMPDDVKRFESVEAITRDVRKEDRDRDRERERDSRDGARDSRDSLDREHHHSRNHSSSVSSLNGGYRYKSGDRDDDDSSDRHRERRHRSATLEVRGAHGTRDRSRSHERSSSRRRD